LDRPDLTFRQVKHWLAGQYGMLVGEVEKYLPRAAKVFAAAQRDARELRALDAAWKARRTTP
jgi:hypothetical protein